MPALFGQLAAFDAWLELSLRLSLLPVLPLVLWSALLCALLTALCALSRFLAGRFSRRDERSVFAWLCALLLLPYVVWVCTELFAGPRAQRLPAHQLLSAGAAVVALLCIRGAVLALLWAQEFIASGAGRASRLGRGLAFFALGLTLTCGFYGADHWVLPRLYPWFHLSLKLLAVAAAQATFFLVTVSRGGQPAPRISSSRLILLGGLIVAGTLFSGGALGRLYRGTVLRGLVLERTTLGAQVMRSYAAYRARRGAPRLPAASPVTTVPLEPLPPSYSGPRLDGRDVFLITVDALRHDRLRPEVMPFTSGLARQGIVFERAYTQVPHTSFAVATLLTGKPVYALLALGHEVASHETLPLVLRRFRYKTAAFYPPSVFYIEHERLKRLEDSAYGFEYVKYEYLAAPRRTEQVMAFLEAEHPQRVFAWVHYLEPHEPYETHPGGPGEKSSDRERYDGEVRFVDGEIERLVTYLSRERPGALVIIAADHGEEFSEHGGRYHGTSLYEEQVHVPLFFVELTKTKSLRPRVLRQPVGLIDVGPTLLGLLDIERSARMRGHDLSPWLLTGADSLPLYPIYAEIGRQKMVVIGDNKLICDLSTDTCQSFNLLADPGEQHNRIDADPDEAHRLRAALERFLDEARRYEAAEGPASDAGNDGAAAVLARARLGDRAVLPSLLDLLLRDSAAMEQKRQALVLFSRIAATTPLSEDGRTDPLAADPRLFAPATLALFERFFAEAAAAPDMKAVMQRRWAAIARLRLFAAEHPAKPAIGDEVVALIEDAQADAEQRLCGALALGALPACQPHPAPKERQTTAYDCVKLWLTALPPALSLQDPAAVRPLLMLLGRSRDPRARVGLVQQLGTVLSRADVVAALGALGDRAAVPPLAGVLLADPYVHVRAAAATALAALGGPAARAALQAAAAKEREAPVRAAIAAALR